MTRLAGIDPAAIAAELRAMWRAAGAQEAQDPAVTRAALLNFILCSIGDSQTESETVARVAAALPCRAIVIEPVPDADPGPALEAWTSMHCRPTGGGKQVCCEQITLRVHRNALDALPSAVWALLLPDLPTALWAPGAFDLESPLIATLAPSLERLVTDTATSKTPARDLVRLDAWRHGDLEVADVAWSRIEAWREGFASFFDAPPFEDSLHQIDTITIEAGRDGHAEGLLFQGWLTSRLGWQPHDPRPRLATVAGTGLQRVVATTGDCRFVIEAEPGTPMALRGAIETERDCPQPWQILRPQRDADAELVGLLQRTRRNVAYEDALAAAAAAVQPHDRPA